MSKPSAEIAHIVAVEKWTQVLAALLLGFGLLFMPRDVFLGAVGGAWLMVLNTWFIRRLAERLLPAWTAQRPSVGLLVILFNLKLLLLAVLLYLGVRLLPVDPLALVLGVSVLPVAILLRALQVGLVPEGADPANQREQRDSTKA